MVSQRCVKLVLQSVSAKMGESHLKATRLTKKFGFLRLGSWVWSICFASYSQREREWERERELEQTWMAESLLSFGIQALGWSLVQLKRNRCLVDWVLGCNIRSWSSVLPPSTRRSFALVSKQEESVPHPSIRSLAVGFKASCWLASVTIIITITITFALAPPPSFVVDCSYAPSSPSLLINSTKFHPSLSRCFTCTLS